MLNVSGPSVLPSGQGSRVARTAGENLLRSMSQSWRENLDPGGQKVVELHRLEKERKVVNQPGSMMISWIFANAQVSQMQPSILEKQGIVLPIVPDDVFEHTIASQPSFEFRVLPEKTIIFFAVNAAILVGTCAGGILSIFFNVGTVS
jgi:hypothetical protein